MTDAQSAIRPRGCAQAPPVIVHTRPLPLLGAFDEAGPRWVEVNVLHFLLIFLNASQSAVEKSRLPEKAPLSSARIDARHVAQSLVFQRLCGFSLIDSITREMVTGKGGNTIAGPAAADPE